MQLMSSRRKPRTEPLGVISGVALVIVGYGTWYWLEFQATALPPWFGKHRRLPGDGSWMFALVAAISLLVAIAFNARRRRVPRRPR